MRLLKWLIELLKIILSDTKEKRRLKEIKVKKARLKDKMHSIFQKRKECHDEEVSKIYDAQYNACIAKLKLLIAEEVRLHKRQ